MTQTAKTQTPKGLEHGETMAQWVMGNAVVPAMAAFAIMALTGLSPSAAPMLLMPWIVLLMIFARFRWTFEPRPTAVLASLGVTTLVLVPIVLALSIGLTKGLVALSGLLAIPVISATGAEAASGAVKGWVLVMFGMVSGAALMALVSAFQNTLTPAEMPVRVDGWILSHIIGGALGGAIIGIGAAASQTAPLTVDVLLMGLVTLLAPLPHALLTWPVWRRTIAEWRKRHPLTEQTETA